MQATFSVHISIADIITLNDYIEHSP